MNAYDSNNLLNENQLFCRHFAQNIFHRCVPFPSFLLVVLRASFLCLLISKQELI